MARPKGSTAATANKMEAVRQCLAAGIENPTEGCQWIQTNLGLTIEPNTFSAYKAQIRKPAKGRKGKGRHMTSVAAPGAIIPHKASGAFGGAHSNGGSEMEVHLACAKALAPLVRKYGAAVLPVVQPATAGLVTASTGF